MGIVLPSSMASSDQKGALADFINADMIDLKEVLRAHQKRQDKAQEGEMGSFYRDKYRSRYMAPVDSAINVQQQTMPAAQSQMGRSQNNNQMALQNTESQNNMSQNTQSGARARSNDGRWPLEQGPKNGGSPCTWRFN